jgi:hypothetical protein
MLRAASSSAGVAASPAFEGRLSDPVFGGGVSTVLAAVGGVPGVDLNPDAPHMLFGTLCLLGVLVGSKLTK